MDGACEADLSALRYVSECVSRRAGYLCAAGLTALLKKMDYKVSECVSCNADNLCAKGPIALLNKMDYKVSECV